MVSQFASRYAVEQCKIDTLIYVSDSAQEALDLLSQLMASGKGLPDFIFLDLVMPEMGGWEFIDRLQETFVHTKETRIFVLSAFSNSKDRNRAKNHSLITGFYDKPITKNIVDSIFTTFIE